MNPRSFNFQCNLNTQIGDTPIHAGDNIEVIDRGDGLWNVVLNNIKINYAIVAEDVNKLAGEKIVGVSA